MRPENMEFILAMFGMAGGFATAWALGYAIYRWLTTRAQRGISADSARQLQEQIAHLQMSIDTMSLEVERISEAQRFTTRLLAGPPEEHVERITPAH